MNYREIKSYEDACKALGLKPISDEVFNAFGQDAKTMAAYHKLAVITRAINGGWQPDWSNKSQQKYEPYIYTNPAGLSCASTHSSPAYANAYFGSRLCFSDYERATFAAKTFGDTLYKDYFRPEPYSKKQEQDTADKKEQNTESENGGDVEEVRHIDDLSDAPDFLQKVGEITQKYIQPLLEEDKQNRAVIFIAVQDKSKDEDSETGLATTFTIAGKQGTLAKGLARFLQHKQNQEIIKSAFFCVKVERLMKEGSKAIKDIINLI